jgi:hypothetical protein
MSRKEDLKKLVNESYSLLGALEEQLRYSSDVLEIARIKREIERQRQFIQNANQELATLSGTSSNTASTSPQPTTTSKLPELATIRQALNTAFSRDDLRELCQDLEVEYDALSGDTKAGKVVSLVDLYKRTSQLDQLVTAIRRMRPSSL